MRKLNKGFSYTNRQLIGTLEHCNKLGIVVSVFFNAGLPFEEEEDFEKTLKLVIYLKRRFSISVIGGCLRLEPGSPMHVYPRKFKVEHDANDLESFIQSSLLKNFNGRPRYRTHAFSEREIMKKVATLCEFCDGVY